MIDSLFSDCCDRNDTIKNMSRKDMSFNDFIKLQKDINTQNKSIKAFFSDDDFISVSKKYVQRLLGDEAAKSIGEAVGFGAICTADHHGALYCAQSFQGDVLFCELLKRLGYKGKYIPIFSTGIVELENSAYARGICVYSDSQEKKFFPFFPAKDSVRLACRTIGIDKELLERAKKRIAKETEGELKDTLLSLCDDIYGQENILGLDDFSAQTMLIGKKLSEKIFSDDGPVFVYIQLEDIINELLISEINDSKSLVNKVLFDEKLAEYLGELSEHIFIAVDEKGRKIPLTMSEGVLIGKDWHKEEVKYEVNTENIIALIEDGILWPDTLLSALVLFFERGISWYGGIFQSVYLPIWQKQLSWALQMTGYDDWAELISNFNCNGYISGPTFAMYSKEDYAVCAGPVECIMSGLNYDYMKNEINKINMYEAHVRGLCEIYFDLVYRNEREENWYERIAKYNGLQYVSRD